MVQQVQVPHSVVEGKKPVASEIAVAGLAVNLKDYTLYTKGYDDVIIRLTGVVEVHDDNETNSVVYLPWVKQVNGKVTQYTSSGKLSFNPSTGRLRATSFAGEGSALTGFTAGQIEDALGFVPVDRIGVALPQNATDLSTAIALVNAIRAALVSCGIAS